MGEQIHVRSESWTGPLEPAAQLSVTGSADSSPLVVAIGCVVAGGAAGWLPMHVIILLAWWQLGSPAYVAGNHVPALMLLGGIGLVALVRPLRAQQWWGRLFIAELLVTVGSGVWTAAALAQAVGHPPAAPEQRYFVEANRSPVYFGSRSGDGDHWHWQWRVADAEGSTLLLAVPETWSERVVAGDSCLIARIDAAGPARLVRSVRIWSAGDGSGSYLVVADNRRRCLSGKG